MFLFLPITPDTENLTQVSFSITAQYELRVRNRSLPGTSEYGRLQSIFCNSLILQSHPAQTAWTRATSNASGSIRRYRIVGTSYLG